MIVETTRIDETRATRDCDFISIGLYHNYI